jgi:hypothetical protein
MPATWDELVKKKDIPRKTRLQLKLLGKMPMAKPMLDTVFTTFKSELAAFQEQHGRDPDKQELADIMEKAIKAMSAGMVKPLRK